jgi:hypothetical protein
LPNGSGSWIIGVSELSGAVRSITSTELSRMASVRACSTDMVLLLSYVLSYPKLSP